LSSAPSQLFAVLSFGIGIFVCLLFGSPSAQGTAPTPITDLDMYAVYASLLPNEWLVSVGRAKKLVIVDEVGGGLPSCLPSGPPMQTDWKPVLEDYVAANRERHVLLNGQPLGIPYEALPPSEAREAVPRLSFSRGLPASTSKYPDSGGGFLYLSAVGFDAARSKAMVLSG
jgi:hypothetical protein